MNKLFAIAVAALFFAAAMPSVDASRTHGGRYTAGEGITIWCSGEPHNLAPIGNPEDYDSVDGWAFSGEPECAGGDAQNAALGTSDEWAYAGFAWIIFPNEKGAFAVASTTDDAFGAGASYINLFASTTDGEGVSQEGCGSQTLLIPQNIANHWQSSPDNPLFLMWASIPPVGTTDDLNVCFASQGDVTATIG